jgi:hypothetical protein
VFNVNPVWICGSDLTSGTSDEKRECMEYDSYHDDLSSIKPSLTVLMDTVNPLIQQLTLAQPPSKQDHTRIL